MCAWHMASSSWIVDAVMPLEEYDEVVLVTAPAQVEQYETEYSALKAPRKLTWRTEGKTGAPVPNPAGRPYVGHNLGQITLQVMHVLRVRLCHI